MNKKYLVIALLIVLGAAGAVAFTMNRDEKPAASNSQTQQEDKPEQLSLKFSDMQANYPSNPAACLATSADSALKLDTAEQTGIENAVGITVIDMPAGTTFDVYVKTIDNTTATATGTAVYESTYGTYNFTAQKVTTEGSEEASWVVTEFVACK